MDNVIKAMENVNRVIQSQDRNTMVPFHEFIDILAQNPGAIIRNVFQVFHDMVKTFVGEGHDEHPDDPESINYVNYDTTDLFVEGSDNPFFADRLFANRFVNHVETLRRGAPQNKIYIFYGPPGCGKSTFLNNLLRKFEEYANTEAGSRYETVWRLSRKRLGGYTEQEAIPLLERVCHLLENPQLGGKVNGTAQLLAQTTDNLMEEQTEQMSSDVVEIPCPSHDHPILMVPKKLRRSFFDDLFKNDEFKWKLFTEKEYDWVFRENSCTICSALFESLLDRLKNPLKVFDLIYARPYRFNRRLGDGISVFNPGDKPMRQTTLTNAMLQRQINGALRDSNQVNYLYSHYAKTNNGIYALMDIKSHNTERLIELHNIISEGLHKVEDLEESVNSLLLALMNPEDKRNVQNIQSFTDRIEYINIPYILDLNTEVEIYRNVFGAHIDESFLPRVLHNFARVVIATRLNARSEGLLEWIGDPKKYQLFCDDNLQLLKMEIYTGYIPAWLSDEDRKRLTAKRRRRIIAESEKEGGHGLSGRDSIKIFGEFYATFAKENKLINMDALRHFFTKSKTDLGRSIPAGFMDSILRMYNYTVLQEVKESLYYYNEEQIAKDIMNYLFAINFELGSTERCVYTGEKIEITEEFLSGIERRLLSSRAYKDGRQLFRLDIQHEYTTFALPQEMLLEGRKISETKLYRDLQERYVHNLKQKVLDPFLENENFRKAIKDYGLEEFRTYDQKIRDDVTFLMKNLGEKCHYSPKGSKEVCIYVIDNDLATVF